MIHPGKYLFCLLLVSLWVADLSAQQAERDILEKIRIFDRFSHLTEEERNLEVNHDAPYEYLLREATIRIEEGSSGIVAQIDYLVRTRILTDDPVYQAEAGLIGIPYYFDQDMEVVRNFEGRVHLADGSFRTLDRRDARDVQLNSRYRILELEIDDVEEGSIIEYKYTLERRYIEELPDFHFSHRVPVREASLYLKNEDFIRYEVVEQNTDFDIRYEEHRVDTSSVPMVFTYQRPDPVYVQSWHAEDVPAVDESAYISSIDDIRGKLKFQISEFGMPRQPLENSWEFVAAQIYRNIQPMRIIDNHPELLQLGDSLYQEISDPLVRQDSIFTHINRKVQFNETNAVFADGGLGHVLEGEPADQAEINMTLLAVMKGAGFDVRPLYMSGREFGRINKSFPSLYQFNRMVVSTRIDGQDYVMDGSYGDALPGLLPPESLNRQGMALEGREYEWLEIFPERSLFGMEVEIEANLTEDGNLIGTMRAVTEGYPARVLRQEHQQGEAAEEIARNTFFDVYEDAVIRSAEVRMAEGVSNRSEVVAEFEIPRYSVTFSDGIEYRPMIVGYLFSNPFEEASRRAPVTLDAPEHLKFRYTIHLPEGFDSDAGSGSSSTGMRGADLNEEYLADGNRLEYAFRINITRNEFEAAEYGELRRIYERWVELSNEVWFLSSGPAQ